ncbi:hypothetical protein HC028_07300 [Planosporangium flavigriseum]|uniref:Putative zinc-finger domain-containing protein n=1 Tax=Planosporangium flavigriseum TaxID=373681 RepID=A0A8J3LJJ7_9ACTN|nr:zf-HC2 domain-containing protein [Planosporangium flavigriseum]NJC64318.1 hypothetical protein [Planosporangium flavigriseum]GIG73842.1 hypothetical protein Pfl04_22460 [Planosporangium flavigriseum]
MTCEQVIDSGAYVLGILDPEDRIAYERHLATCVVCQREVADFTGLPDLLAQLGPDEVEAIGRSGERHANTPSRFEAPVPVRPLPSVPRSNPAEQFQPYGSSRMPQRGGQRRPSRWRAVAAGLAAAACVAFGVLIGARFINDTPTPPAMVAMRPVAESVPITAQVALTPFAGGTEVRMHCVYNGGGSGPRWSLHMLVYPKNGEAPEKLSTWTAGRGDDLTLSAATRFSPAEIGKVEIRKGDNSSLLVYEQA